MVAYIIFGVTYAFAAAVQPGPFQTFIISQTLKNGWKRTLSAAFAPVLSDGPIIVLVLFILTNVPEWFLQVLQICGGLLLLYLAFKSYQAFREYDAGKVKEDDKSDKTLLKAILVNAINPAPYIGWSLIMGPTFLKGYNVAPVNGISLIISFYVILVLSQMGIILLFGLARNLGPKVTHITLAIASVALAGFGIYQLWQGIYSY